MRIPVVTLFIVGLCIFLEFGFLNERKLENYKNKVCLESAILRDFKNEAYRLFVSCFFHANVQHLAINMLSLWSVGYFVESAVGSFSMATIFLSFTLLSSSLTITIQSYMINNPQIEFPIILGNPRSCAIGISGVIFAMDVLASSFKTEGLKGYIYVWLHVLVISAFVPNVSLVSHVSGVLVGSLYTFFIHSEDVEDVQPKSFWKTLFWISIVGLCSPFAISHFYASKQQNNFRTWSDIYDNTQDFYERYGKNWFQSPTKQLKKTLIRWNIIEDKSTLIEQAQSKFEQIFLQVQNSDAVKATAKFLQEKIGIDVSREMIVWILISLAVVMLVSLIQASCSSSRRRRGEEDD